jgi:histidyl-tRNA synthetase
MSQPLSTAPLPGVRDFFPEEMSVRQQVFERLYRVVESFGYLRYDGPMLEPYELYAAKSGQELVNQQVYRFTDRGERDVVIRPEMTPTVARMIAQKAGQLTLPARWYSHPNLYRYERQSRGRKREHWQINVDVFGTDAHTAEIEVLELGAEMMFALGAKTEDFLLRVSDRGLVEAVLTQRHGVAPDKLRDVFAVLDQYAKVPPEASRARLLELGVSEPNVGAIVDELGLTGGGEGFLAMVEREMPELVEKSLAARVFRDGLVTSKPVNLKFDPSIIRGFDYYTSTVFEIYDTDPANRRSIAGGGRYDNLVALFGKDRLPGIGFGMGDVTLIDFLETHGIIPRPRVAPDVIVLSPTPDEPGERRRLREIAHALRSGDRPLRVTVPLEGRKLNKELERATKDKENPVRFAVIAGSAEAARGVVKLKDLASRSEIEVAIADLRGTIFRILDESGKKDAP